MSKVKVGLIGAGSIAVEHIKGYLNNADCEVYAVCDINEALAKKRAEEYNIPHVFSNVDEMLALPELDAVSVCVLNALHAEMSIKALKAGKHVLCEKPMSTDMASAIEMAKAEEESGKLLMIGFVRRFGNDAEVIKDYIDAGELGDIYYSRAKYVRRRGTPGGWFTNKKLSGGGPLIDLAVHVIDLTRYLAGNPKPVSVYGFTSNKLGNRSNIKDGANYTSSTTGEVPPSTVEDFATALVRYDNGSVLEVTVSFELNIAKDETFIEMCGTKGGFRLDPELTIYTDKFDRMINITPYTSAALTMDGLFEKETNHFIDCIANGKKCISPASDGVEVMKILDAIYRSAESGHEVIL